MCALAAYILNTRHRCTALLQLRAEYEREMLKIKQFNAEKMLSEFHVCFAGVLWACYVRALFRFIALFQTNVELTLDARHWFPKVVDDAAGERQKYDEEDVEDEDDESIDLPPAPLTIFESIAQRDSSEEHISIPVRSSPRHGNISIRRRILGLAELLPKFRGMQIVHSNEVASVTALYSYGSLLTYKSSSKSAKVPK